MGNPRAITKKQTKKQKNKTKQKNNSEQIIKEIKILH